MSNETNNISVEELKQVDGGALNMKQAIEIAERAVNIYRNIKHVADSPKDKEQFHDGSMYNTIK